VILICGVFHSIFVYRINKHEINRSEILGTVGYDTMLITDE